MRQGYALAAAFWASLVCVEITHHPDGIADGHLIRLLLAFGVLLICWLLAERDARRASA